MDCAEEAQSEIPRGVVAEDRVRGARILGEMPGEPAVDRRAEHREVLRLPAEDVRLTLVQAEPGSLARAQAASASSAALACSATAANAGGSRDRDVGERLAVELDTRLVQTGDELVVRQAVLARRSIDPDDPELPERPLLVLAVAVGVGERVLDLLLGVRVVRVLEAPVPLRLLQDLAALLARRDRTLHPGHRLPQPQQALDGRHVRLGDRLVLAEAALTLRALVLEVVALHRVAADQLARSAHLEALLRSASRLHFRHLVSLLRFSSAREP